MLSKYSLHPYKGAGYFFTYSDFRLYQSPTEWIGKKLSCVLFSLSEKHLYIAVNAEKRKSKHWKFKIKIVWQSFIVSIADRVIVPSIS